MARKIIVHIATSADGYIARRDGSLEWLIDRPAPKGSYGLPDFEKSIDAKILGRKTFDWSLRLGGGFGGPATHYVFSRRASPARVPRGVQFVNETVAAFARRVRQEKGKNLWLMGGGEIIASFLDAGAIDELVMTIMPVFIGAGIPLLAPQHRHVPLHLLSTTSFPDDVVQLHYGVAVANTSVPT